MQSVGAHGAKPYIEGTEPSIAPLDYNLTEFPVDRKFGAPNPSPAPWGPTESSTVVEDLLLGERASIKASIAWAKKAILDYKWVNPVTGELKKSKILQVPSLMMAAAEDLGINFGLVYTFYSDSKECIFNAIATQYGVKLVPRRSAVRAEVEEKLDRVIKSEDKDHFNQLLGRNIVLSLLSSIGVELRVMTRNIPPYLRGPYAALWYTSVNPQRPPLTIDDLRSLGGVGDFLKSWAEGDLTVIANDSFGGTVDSALSAQPIIESTVIGTQVQWKAKGNGVSSVSPAILGEDNVSYPLSQFMYYRQAPLPVDKLNLHINGVVSSKVSWTTSRSILYESNLLPESVDRLLNEALGLQLENAKKSFGNTVFRYSRNIWEGPPTLKYEYKSELDAYKISQLNKDIDLGSSSVYLDLAADVTQEHKDRNGDVVLGKGSIHQPLVYRDPLAALTGYDGDTSADTKAPMHVFNHLAYGSVQSAVDLSPIEILTTAMMNTLINTQYDVKEFRHGALLEATRDNYLRAASETLKITATRFKDEFKVLGSFIPLSATTPLYRRVDRWFKSNGLASNDFYSLWGESTRAGLQAKLFVRKTSEGFIFLPAPPLEEVTTKPTESEILDLLESNPIVIQQNSLGPLLMPIMARTDILTEDYAIASIGDQTNASYLGYHPGRAVVRTHRQRDRSHKYNENTAIHKRYGLPMIKLDKWKLHEPARRASRYESVNSGMRLLNDCNDPTYNTITCTFSEMDKLVELVRTGQFRPTGGLQVCPSSTQNIRIAAEYTDVPTWCSELYASVRNAIENPRSDSISLTGKMAKPYYPYSGVIKDVVLDGAFGGGTAFFAAKVITADMRDRSGSARSENIATFRSANSEHLTAFNCASRHTFVGTRSIPSLELIKKSDVFEGCYYPYLCATNTSREKAETLRIIETGLPTTVGRTTYNDVLLAGLSAASMARMSAVLRGIRSPFQFEISRSDFMFKSLSSTRLGTVQRGQATSTDALPVSDYIAAPTVGQSLLDLSSNHKEVFSKGLTKFSSSGFYDMRTRDAENVGRLWSGRFKADEPLIAINPLDAAQMAALMPGVIATEVIEEELTGESLSIGLRDNFNLSVACLIGSPRGSSSYESYVAASEAWSGIEDSLRKWDAVPGSISFGQLGDISNRTYTVTRAKLDT